MKWYLIWWLTFGTVNPTPQVWPDVFDSEEQCAKQGQSLEMHSSGKNIDMRADWFCVSGESSWFRH